MRTPEQTMKALERRGYKVEKLTPYQYRIECVFDLYVIRFRWHNIANNTRGSWHGLNEQQLTNLIDQQVAIADAILDREIAAGRITEECEPVAVGKRDVDSAIWWTKKGLEKSRGKTN
jgi:hypothetical protein